MKKLGLYQRRGIIRLPLASSKGPVWDKPGSDPETLVADTFTDTNGTNLTSHTPETGGAWATYTPGPPTAWSIQSNKATKASTNGVAQLAYQDTGEADVTITLTVVDNDGDDLPGILARYVSHPYYWALVVDINNDLLKLIKCSGAEAVEDSAALSLTAGVAYDLTLVLSGSSITGACGGAEVSATDTITPAEDLHGLYAKGTSVTFDDLTIVTN